MNRAQRWVAAWRRKRNRFQLQPDGSWVIESRLPWWQAAVGTASLLLYCWLDLPLPVPLGWAGAGGGGAVLAVWVGLYSRLEIGPDQAVLHASGWFGRAVRVSLAEVVLEEEVLTTGTN